MTAKNKKPHLVPLKPQLTQFQILDSAEFVDILEGFGSYIRSCMGSLGGGQKILVTENDHLTVTSSSSRLLTRLEVDHPIISLLKSMMNGQLQAASDFGLYAGTFTTYLLLNTLKCNIPSSQTQEIFGQLCSKLLTLLSTDLHLVKIPLDFGSVTQLLPFVRTIVQSKCGCTLEVSEMEELCIQLIKAFAGSIPHTGSTNDLGKICVVKLNGDITHSEAVIGVAYPLPDVEQFKLWESKRRQLQTCKAMKLLIFNVMLTEDDDNMDVNRSCQEIHKNAAFFSPVVHRVLDMIKRLDANNTILACQKVVHPVIFEMMSRKGVLVLERLGSDAARALEGVSGARPISTFSEIEVTTHLGEIQSVELVERCDTTFLLMKNDGGRASTLLLGYRSEENWEELKVVVNQTIDSLQLALQSPFVLPGGGCFESWLSVQLRIKVNEDAQLKQWAKNDVRIVLSAFEKAFSSIIDNKCFTDSVYFHLWNPTREICKCGLVSKDMVTAFEGHWYCAYELPNVNIESVQCLPVDTKTLPTHAVIDLCYAKVNALKLSLETCQNVLNIGAVVFA